MVCFLWVNLECAKHSLLHREHDDTPCVVYSKYMNPMEIDMENTQGTNGVAAGQAAQPSYAELLAQVEKLKAQAASRQTSRMLVKMSEKGGVSVYGLGRFPVTLYQSQWDALIAFIPEVKAFIEEHRSELAVKE